MRDAPPAWRIWLMAARPKTLPAAWAPVVIGSAMAWGAEAMYWPSALACLLGATLIQIGTNFANDYFDFAHGTDTADRTGPTRITQAGLVSPAQMRWLTAAVFALACIPGAYIIYRGGWPFVVIGALSIIFGVLYTGGPFPLGYLGLGDILVLIFFGPLAAGGTFYLQAYELPTEVIVSGLAPGLLSVALLTVNNLRDIDGDRQAGKRTLAVRFGPKFARWEYLVAVITACLIVPMYLYASTGHRLFALLALVTTLFGVMPIRVVFQTRDGNVLNQVLARTGKLLLLYSVVFTLCYAL